MTKRFIMLTLASLLILMVAAGCRESNKDEVTAENVNIEVDVANEALAVGASTLLVTITDDDDDPVEEATVVVRGDMDHAGMVPIISEPVTENEAGVYRVPIEWTMGGDWIVIVTVTLPDASIAEQEFNYVVSGDGMDDMDMGDMTAEPDMDMDMTEEPDMDMNMTEEVGS